MRLRNVTFTSGDPERLADFWAAAGDDDFRWTVMRDPDGNQFCVTD